MIDHSVFWQCLYTSGCEIARLSSDSSSFELSGTTLFLEDQQKISIQYQITCDQSWRTRAAMLVIDDGAGKQHLTIEVDEAQNWLLNEVRVDGLAGCIDVDLGFTPVSNTLPIRRLNLTDGSSKDTRVAWLKFPSLELVSAKQTYRRINAECYSYLNHDSGFSSEIMVDKYGMVSLYPGLWEAK